MKTIKLLAIATVAALTFSCNTKGNNAAGTAAKASAEKTDGSIQRINIDSTMTLIHIQDNNDDKFMPNSLFYGTTDSALVNALSPSGKVEASISCFIIESKGKRALFDTGNGAENGGMLMQRLDSAGISADSIDYLFITHFHNDHIGGMTINGQPAFSRAEVYVPNKEYKYWVENAEPNGKAAKAMKAYAGRLHRFEYSDQLPMGIKPMAAPGHTPGHTVYQKGGLLIVGDLFHGLSLQLEDLRISPAYDMDRKQAIETRLKFTNYAKNNRLLTAGMHYPGNGTSDLKKYKKSIPLD